MTEALPDVFQQFVAGFPFQKRTFRAAACQPFGQYQRRCGQIYRCAFVFQKVHVAFEAWCSASQREHEVVFVGHYLAQMKALHFPESAFSVTPEYFGHRHFLDVFDVFVQVYGFKPQHTVEVLAHSGFAAAHIAHQNYFHGVALFFALGVAFIG